MMKPVITALFFSISSSTLLLLSFFGVVVVYAQTTNTTTPIPIPPAAATNATTTNNATAAATNATTTAANNTTRIITNLTWYTTQRVDQLSPEAIQYQREDPAFAKLAQITFDCLNEYNAIFAKIEANPGSGTAYTVEDIQSQDLCTDVIRQGINQFCESTDFATFDIKKCEEARKMSETYVQVVETIFG